MPGIRLGYTDVIEQVSETDPAKRKSSALAPRDVGFAGTPTFAKAPLRAGVRKARPGEPSAKVSAWSCVHIWFVPFLAEAVLLFGALWWSICLHRAIWSPGAQFPIWSTVFIIGTYASLAHHARVHELFMPRVVVTIGVGIMAILAFGACISILSDAYLLGSYRRLVTSGLVVIPLVLFILRSICVFRAARYTPSLGELALRTRTRPQKRNWRSKLRFWLN